MAYSLSSTNDQRKSDSMAALQDRLSGLEAGRLETFLQKQRDQGAPSSAMSGLVDINGGLSSPAFDAYRQDKNAQGEIAKIRDIMGGGSGELNMRAGGQMISDGEAAQDRIPQSVSALGRTAYDAGGATDINDPSGRYKEAIYKKKMADLAAGTAQAGATEHAAFVAQDPRVDHITDQYRTDQKLENAGKVAQFQREQVGPDTEATTAAGISRDQSLWNDTTQDWMRRWKEKLLLAPTEQKGQTAVDVANINRARFNDVAGATTGSKEYIAALSEANKNLRTLIQYPMPGDPAYAKQLQDAYDEKARLDTMRDLTPSNELGRAGVTKSLANQGVIVR